MDKKILRENVEKILRIIKCLVKNKKYELIPRDKNNLPAMGYSLKLFEFTIQELTYINYIEGPNFNNKHGNNVWVFGYDDNIENIQIYIKFGIDRKEDRVCFISFHRAEYELRYFDWR